MSTCAEPPGLARRRCQRGERCVQSERIADGSNAGKLLTTPGICDGCTVAIERGIAELPSDYAQLTALIGSGSGSDGEYVSSSRELPVPIRLGVDALRREIDFTLQFWASRVSAGYSIYHATHSRVGVRVQDAAHTIANRLDSLLALPEQNYPAWDLEGRPTGEYYACTGIDGALHLLELHHRAYRVAGRTRLVHRLTPACPWCDAPSLVRDNGSDNVHCEACGKTIEEKHYDWFVRTIVEDEERRRRVA